jgi:hypothetical protein
VKKWTNISLQALCIWHMGEGFVSIHGVEAQRRQSGNIHSDLPENQKLLRRICLFVCLFCSFFNQLSSGTARKISTVSSTKVHSA